MPLCYAYIYLLLYLFNRHPHVIISPIEMNCWILRENFLKELLSELPKCNGLYDITWFIQLTLSAFWIHVIYHYNSQPFHVSHQRVPVLASSVIRFLVLYEVINTFNIEVHVEVQLSFLVHLYDPFVLVFYKVVFHFLDQTHNTWIACWHIGCYTKKWIWTIH